jgi:protein gp37
MGFGKRDPWADIYLTKTWEDPYAWERELAGTNRQVRVFTCSLSDFFHADVDGRRFDEEGYGTWLKQHRISGGKGGLYHTHWRDAAWQVIKDTPHLTYQILSKRPERIIDHLPKGWPFANVWLGTSTGCRRTLSKIDSLRKVPIHPEAVRFLSCEPLLEDIADEINLDGIGWVIAGGESGFGEEYRYDPDGDWRKEMRESLPGRRTMDFAWAYRLYMRANNLGIPFFFKQCTGARSGEGADRLTGKLLQEYPAPPTGQVWWTPPEKESAEELIQIERGKS